MVITYFGNGSFRLQSGDTVLFLNPENNRLKADVTLRTLAGTATERTLERRVRCGNDNFLSRGIRISWHRDRLVFRSPTSRQKTFIKTAYKIIFEDMTFVFLGHLSQPLDATLMEEFSEPDVLILPVGGGHFLEPEVAAKIAKQLEARSRDPEFCKKHRRFFEGARKKN